LIDAFFVGLLRELAFLVLSLISLFFSITCGNASSVFGGLPLLTAGSV
jgi:hypothetical protein